LQELYKNNIFPVILDGIRYDNRSKPPPIRVSTGRPKKKRFRTRTKFVESAESPIVCQKCKQGGNNRRTYDRRQRREEKDIM